MKLTCISQATISLVRKMRHECCPRKWFCCVSLIRVIKLAQQNQLNKNTVSKTIAKVTGQMWEKAYLWIKFPSFIEEICAQQISTNLQAQMYVQKPGFTHDSILWKRSTICAVMRRNTQQNICFSKSRFQRCFFFQTDFITTTKYTYYIHPDILTKYFCVGLLVSGLNNKAFTFTTKQKLFLLLCTLTKCSIFIHETHCDFYRHSLPFSSSKQYIKQLLYQ